ncbi:MAG: AAA family ATPase [Gemmatimonadetes bacterium]|nr:AAA family ATPase [Gemmatimonadota bacterium]
MAHRLNVLGPPEVLDDRGDPVSLSLGKPLALLVYVACADAPVSRDDLAELLWPEADHQRGRHSVRQAVWVLKNALKNDIFANHDPLSIQDDALEVDLHEFTDALAEGRVEDARQRWRGPVLDHFLLAGVRQWNRWTEDLRSALEARFTQALLHHARVLAEGGNPEAALEALGQAVEVAPASEACHQERIRLYLDLLRLDEARKALSDAHRELGDTTESTSRLTILEEQLERIALEQRSRVRESESFPMEFVGRSRELASLHSLWRDVDLGRTRVTVITGPSGIGKTRLAQELLSYVSGDEVWALSLKGTRGESTLRWGAVSDLIRQLLRLPGSAGISSASDSLLRAMLPSMGRDAINLHFINGVSPAAVLDATTDLLEATTFEHPLVILVDDFQWMDPESRTLFLGLANRCREHRVFFLILGRSDLSSRHWERMEAELVEEAGASRLVLEPLIEEEVGELLALGAAFPDPGDAAGIVTKIHRATGGNPLFLREVLKELHEKGILRREEPGWVFQTSELPDEFELPENIRVLLRERMDRLSEAGAELAATLARENRACSSELLQARAQLPTAVFTAAIAELLDRGVVEWVDGSSLDFVHDLLRDIASRHLAGPRSETLDSGLWFGMRPGVLWAAAIILIALPLGVLWGTGNLPWEPPPDPPPFGGGIIAFSRGEGPIRALQILEGPLERYEAVELDPPSPPRARFLYRGPGGNLIYFGIDSREDGPDLVRITGDGTRIPFFPLPGDQSLHGLSPDGRRIAFTSENMGRERFSHSIYWADVFDPDEKHLIYEGTTAAGMAEWSGDGDRIAFVINTPSDSVAVYSLRGERLWAEGFGEVHGLDWCGESLMVAANRNGEIELFQVDVLAEAITPLASTAIGRGLTCSPDGTALIQLDVVDGRAAFLLRDLQTGAVHPFREMDVHNSSPHWVPDQVSVIPTEIRAAIDDTVRMTWGESRSLSATVLHSDRSEQTDGIWWEALDPEIANFNPEQELVGNQEGIARVLARWGHSLVDTVAVVVQDLGTGGPAAILNERWDDPDLSRWITFGSHPPATRNLDGEEVLQLSGDEKYSDGVILRQEIPLDQGITVEYEFKMELTADVHQNVRLCLRDLDRESINVEVGTLGEAGEIICFLYPSREFGKLDPAEAYLRITPGVETLARVPEDLPTSDWTHVAIQVRADGECSLVINRKRVATSPILVPTRPHAHWTVSIDGDAVDTEVFIRNLNIWREVRY